MKGTAITVGIVIGFLLISGVPCCQSASVVVIGPYPQQATMTSVIVSWQTATPTARNEVHWGRNPDLGTITVEKNLFSKTFHAVTLTGLTAATTYYYTVVSDETESPRYTVHTASPRNDTIRFVAYGDSRGGWDNWGNTLLVARAIEQAHPAFVLNTGDLVDNGRNEEDWVDFFSASLFVHNSTLYPVLGNHENYSTLYFMYFSLPHHERWYSFDNGPVHFIGLDSNPRNAYRPLQSLWLLRELRTRTQPFTIVVFHHPLFSSGEEHGNTTLLQKVWAPVFEHFHVDIVFNGHDHDYERSIVKNVTYIVTGGGGAPLYNVGHSSWTVYSEKTYHFCLLSVNSSTLTFEAIKPDGSVFDSFFLSK